MTIMVSVLTRKASGGGNPPSASVNARVAIQGQSNAYGVGPISEIASLPDATLGALVGVAFSRVYIWVPTTPSSGSYQQLVIGTNNDGYLGTNIGPEFGLAVRWQRETATGNLYIDKQYGDGQPIANFQQGTSFFTINELRNTAASAWLSSRSITAPMSGYVWVQGESNAGSTQAAYQTALESLFSSRVSVGLLPNAAKRFLVQMRSGTVYYGAGVAAAKTAYAAANTSTTSTYEMPAYFNADNIHLNARGQTNTGYAAYAAIFGAASLTV